MLIYHSFEWYQWLWPFAMREHLSSIQADVLSAIRRRVDRGDPVPSYRELCDEFGWRSTATVRDHLKALARKGYLELSGQRHRQIRLLRDDVPVSRVPLLGRVVAGSPRTAEQHIDGFLPVPGNWTSNGDYFAVRVRGSCMVDAGILEGDYIIARHQLVAADGDVVVARTTGEMTLNRLKRTPAGSMLVAENPRHRLIPVRAEDASVLGVVVGLLRAYRRAGATRLAKKGVGERGRGRT